MIVLAGDVGGTNARLALVELRGRALRVLGERAYASPEYSGLAPIARAFLQETGARPERACFGIAGPVVSGEVRTSNLPWVVNAAAVGDAIGLAHTSLINDLYATARGISRLGPHDFAALQVGQPVGGGARAVIAPGTGLGEAVLVRGGRGWRALASEGGHASFAPRSQLEWELQQWLARRFGHVSNERILSGPGLRNVYEFLAGRAGARESAAVHADIAREEAKAISRHALAGSDQLCVEALDLFCSVLGAVAGDLALIALAQGGVFVAGGIPPHILPRLRRGPFLDAFRDKGRMSGLVESMPVHVVVNEQVGLYGAALAAAEPGLRAVAGVTAAVEHPRPAAGGAAGDVPQPEIREQR